MGVLLLVIAVAIGFKAYSVWNAGPWDLPEPVKPRPPALTQVPAPPTPAAGAIVNTDAIVAKNLFDPERGAVKTQESEAEVRSVQRVRNMVLLGTAIIDNSRYAIVQEPDNNPVVPGAPAQQRPQTVRRLKLGDNIEGFSVSEIADKRVILTKGPTRVEVAVDYFRKVAPTPATAPGTPPPGPVAVPLQPGAPPTPGTPVPNPVPNLPRRPRLPTPPSP